MSDIYYPKDSGVILYENSQTKIKYTLKTTASNWEDLFYDKSNDVMRMFELSETSPSFYLDNKICLVSDVNKNITYNEIIQLRNWLNYMINQIENREIGKCT